MKTSSRFHIMPWYLSPTAEEPCSCEMTAMRYLRASGPRGFLKRRILRPASRAATGPGRVSAAGSAGRRSAVEGTNWHDIEEHRFAQRVATAMEQLVRTSKAKALIIVAPPRTLADLRNAFHSDVKACIIAEINKDLTKHSVGKIKKHLMSDA